VGSLALRDLRAVDPWLRDLDRGPGWLGDLWLGRFGRKLRTRGIAHLGEAGIRDDWVGRAAGNTWVVDSALHAYEFSVNLTDLI
jgi:hypothetical protein